MEKRSPAIKAGLLILSVLNFQLFVNQQFFHNLVFAVEEDH